MFILSPLAGWAFTLFIRKLKIYGAHEYFVFFLIKKVNKKINSDVHRNPKEMSSAFLQWLSAAG